MGVIKSEREEIIKAGNESEFKEKQTSLIKYYWKIKSEGSIFIFIQPQI